MTFETGISGNPNGRPRGIKDRRSIFREMVEPYKKELIDKAIKLALDGNEQMLRLLLSRLLPAKPKEDIIEIGELDGTRTEQCQKILIELCNGNITPSEAHILIHTLAIQTNMFELDEVTKKLKEIEESLKNKQY